MVFVFLLLAVAIVLFITEWIRADVVGLLVVAALLLGGQLTSSEAWHAFGNPVILMIAGLYSWRGDGGHRRRQERWAAYCAQRWYRRSTHYRNLDAVGWSPWCCHEL